MRQVVFTCFVVMVSWLVFEADCKLSCKQKPGTPLPKDPITDYERDGTDGRALCVRAIIRKKDLDHGEKSDDVARDYIKRMGAIKNAVNPDEAGHLIAARLGGTRDTYNIVPQNRNCNRGSLWKFGVESSVYNYSEKHTVEFIVKPIYVGANTRPDALQYEYYVDGQLKDGDIIPNPHPPTKCG